MRFRSASTKCMRSYSQNAFGFEVVALRYFNVYGPRQRPDSMYAAAVPIFARRLLDGKADDRVWRRRADPRSHQCARYCARQFDGIRTSKCGGEEFSMFAQVLKRVCWICSMCMYELFPNAPNSEFAAPRAGRYLSFRGKPAKSFGCDGFPSTGFLGGRLKRSDGLDARKTNRLHLVLNFY